MKITDERKGHHGTGTLPTIVENSHNCTVSVQVITTTITGQHGTRKGPDEICLLIEDEDGDHVATFTPAQAAELMRALHRASERITGLNSTTND